ncbi:hypothetical protein DL771_004590 [Monosporascus sp. 5C6A]|nr:hypothetical protein DL771_004590 [Monosporascus sp. 5C6A]
MPAQLKSALLVLATAAVAAGQAYRYIGCFTEPPEHSRGTPDVFQSVGLCQNRCSGSHQPVAALGNGTDCHCGNLDQGQLPPMGLLVDDGYCNLPCPGFYAEMCGGDGFFSVYREEPTAPEEPSGTQSQGAGAEVTGGAATQEPPPRAKCSRGSRAQPRK